MGELEIFSTRIKELRETIGMTQNDFSNHIGIKQQTLSGYERGIMKPPIDVVKNIAEKCHVSIDWLCGLSDKKKNDDSLQTYGDIINILFDIDQCIDIAFDSDSSETYIGIFFDDGIINNFLREWMEATNVRDNTAINRDITKAMYDSWEKSKLEELNRKKLKKKRK